MSVGAPRERRSGLPARRETAWLVAILALAALLRLALPFGYLDADVLAYSWHARLLAEDPAGLAERVLASLEPGASRFPGLQANVRLGMSLPMAAAFGLFGVGRASAIAWPFVGSLLHVVAAWLVGRRLFSPRVGLAAAALLASVPLEIQLATHVEPDVLSAAFAALAFVALLAAETRRGAGALGMGAAAGLLLGWSFLCKEAVVLVMPLFLLWAAARWWQERRMPAAHVGFALGALVPPVAELAFYAATAGMPLFRVHLMEVIYVQSPTWSWREYSAAHPDHPVLRRALLDLPLLLAKPWVYGWLAPASLVSLVAVLRRSSREERVVATWLAFAFLALAFGSTSLHSYSPLYLLDRYYVYLSLPAAVLVARALERAASRASAPSDRARRRVVLWSLVAAALAVALAVALTSEASLALARSLYERLREEGRFALPFAAHQARVEQLLRGGALGGALVGLVAAWLASRARAKAPEALWGLLASAAVAALVLTQAAVAVGTSVRHGDRERLVLAKIEELGLSDRPIYSDLRAVNAFAWLRDLDTSGLRHWAAGAPAPGEDAVVVVPHWWLRPEAHPAWTSDGSVPLREVAIVEHPPERPSRILVTARSRP